MTTTREVDGDGDLATIAALVRADRDGAREFGGFYGQAPTRLGPLLSDERRVWLVLDGATVAGFVDADLVGRELGLSYFVAAAHRGRGLAAAAVLEVVDAIGWERADVVVAAVSPTNTRSAAVVRRAGFTRAEPNRWGEDVWELRRPPPG